MLRDFRSRSLMLLAGAALAAAGSAHAASQQSLQINVAGTPRDYIVATPQSPATGPMPLVILLHGHIGTAANVLGEGRSPSPLSAWLNIADREHVMLAALQGLKGSDGYTGWNDCRTDTKGGPTGDDVAFAQDVVAKLVQSGRVDPKRIYVMGMSNGSMMSFRLALQMKPTPAAIAAVSGTMASNSACHESPGVVSVLMIDGTSDPIVPYAGGPVGVGRNKAGPVIGFDATRDFWLKADGLTGAKPVSQQFPHRSGSGDTSATKVTYGSDSGPQVEAVTIKNGGHVEPSLRYHYGWIYSRIVGNQNRDFESAEEAWRFFKDKSAK